MEDSAQEDPMQGCTGSIQDKGLSYGEETPPLKCTGHLFAPVFYPKIFQNIVSTLALQHPDPEAASNPQQGRSE